MNKNINSDNKMREKLNGFSVQPPSHVWGNVQVQLAAQQKRKRIIYFGRISAAAVVLLAFLAGWYFNNNNKIKTPIVAEQQTIQPKNSGNNIEIQKEKNSKLAKKEPVKNDSNLLKNINKNTPKINKILIATTEKTEEKNTKILTPSNYKREEMAMLKSIDAKFKNDQPEILLAEKAIPAKEHNLTNTDKFLMASNATSIKSKHNSETGWKIGVGVTPGYSSYVANHSETYSQNMNYSSENGNGNIGGGFSVQYKTSKKLRIESGVYYAQNGQISKNPAQIFANREMADYARAAPEKAMLSNTVNISNGNVAMNSTAGIIVMSGTPKGAEINSELDAFNPKSSNSLVSDGEFSQVFDFVEIPLYLRYRVLDSKFGIELVGGVNAGVVVGNNAYIDNNYGLQNIGKTQDISTINLSGTVGVGLNYALGKHISVAVEPRFNYYFTSINNNPEVDFRPYRVGIFTGLYYEF